MRISDWSSDVCSSDLQRHLLFRNVGLQFRLFAKQPLRQPRGILQSNTARTELTLLFAKEGFVWRVMEINPQIVWEHELHPPHRIISSRQLAHAYIFAALRNGGPIDVRSEEHTSELQSLMRISYAVFCLKKKNNIKQKNTTHSNTNI